MTDSVLTAPSILKRFQLDGRTALVTGGGQGIGRAFAHALGEAGAAVAVVDISLPHAEEVVAELEAKGIDAIALKADVTKTDDIQKVIDAVLAKWGKLTIGVNNAGIGQWMAAEDMPESDWDRMLDLNLKGVFLCSQAEARVMLESGYGKIINTASMTGTAVVRPQPQAHYNAAKAGVIQLSRSLAGEWSPRGICVNTISPGYTRTKLVDDLLQTPAGQEILPHWLANTPMNCLGDVTDLQGAIVYLASGASDFMTGNDMIIDGGYCIW